MLLRRLKIDINKNKKKEKEIRSRWIVRLHGWEFGILAFMMYRLMTFSSSKWAESRISPRSVKTLSSIPHHICGWEELNKHAFTFTNFVYCEKKE